MDPKFQSSFIPKGPSVSSPLNVSMVRKEKKPSSLFGFLAVTIFILSVLAALGLFGYKFYLKYRIEQMGSDLEAARATLNPEVIKELVNLNTRIVSTKDLIARHKILTPLFAFLEASTPKTVRFKDFRYGTNGQNIELTMRGEARGYAALALQADIINKSSYFINPVFSDLTLNEKGDVSFTLKVMVDPSLVSYSSELERNAPAVTEMPVNQKMMTATTTTSVATSTSSTSSSQAAATSTTKK